MFKKMLTTAALALFTLTSTVVAASAAPLTPPAVVAPAVVASSAVTPAEAASLRYMREEEKLAHDVYVTLYKTWGLPVFNNIAASEQTHTDAVKVLLDRYQVTDPTGGNGVGEFDNAELQALYNKLVAQGKLSVGDALKVGAAIEEIDILDLQERVAETAKADIQQVYKNLEAASGNHLRAFVSNLKARTGETYRPQYMSQAAYDTIAAGTNGRRGRGRW